MKLNFIFFLLIFSFYFSFSQYRKPADPVWTIGTAKTVGYKNLFVNSSYYFQYGLTNKVELQSNLISFIKIPNFGAKISWFSRPANLNKKIFKNTSFIFGSRHLIYYPTPLLNYFNRDSLFGVNFNYDIPFIIVFKNEALITAVVNKRKGCYRKLNIFTLTIGNITSLYNKQNSFIVEKNAKTYKNTAFLSNNSLWYLGLDFDSRTGYGLNFKISAKLYSVGLKFNNLILEQTSLGYFYADKMNNLRICLGYKIFFTNYPNIKPSLIPVVGLSYRIIFKNNSKSNELFDKNFMPKADEDFLL